MRATACLPAAFAVILASASSHALSCGSEVGGAWHGFENVPRDAHLWFHTCSWPEMGARPTFGTALIRDPDALARGQTAVALREAKTGTLLAGSVKAWPSDPPVFEIVPSTQLAAHTAYELVVLNGTSERMASAFTTGERTGTDLSGWRDPTWRSARRKLGRYEWRQEWLKVSAPSGALPLVRSVERGGAPFRVFYVSAQGEISSGFACSCQATFKTEELVRSRLSLQPLSARAEPGPRWTGRLDGNELHTSRVVSPRLVALAVSAVLSAFAGIAWILARRARRGSATH